MITWNFNESEVETNSFALIPEGDYRVRIDKATAKKSKSGNDMIEMELAVSGYSSHVWFYMVFMPDNSKITNTRLAQIWDSFDIPKGNVDERAWVGHVGACHIKHEEYNGEKTPRVHYFIGKDKQAKLPAWNEGNSSATNAPAMEISNADLPF